MTVSRRKVLIAFSVLAAAGGLSPAGLLAAPSSQTPGLKRGRLSIHSDQGPHTLRVEIASTLTQRGRGLMDRDALDPDAGMLFLYDRPQSSRNGFWMYRTRIPLDIAFIDEDGRILHIATMTPCESSNPAECPVTRPSDTYTAALEVNAGYFAERGIKVGDCVTLPGANGMCAP